MQLSEVKSRYPHAFASLAWTWLGNLGLFFVGLMLGVVGTAHAANSERRVALVIGNSAYQQMQSLGSASASSDADAMADLDDPEGLPSQ